MHEPYRDHLDGAFVPEILLTKRADNGHYTASACGLTVTHPDQATAVNRLTEHITSGLTAGTILPAR